MARDDEILIWFAPSSVRFDIHKLFSASGPPLLFWFPMLEFCYVKRLSGIYFLFYLMVNYAINILISIQTKVQPYLYNS
jgi:hypothetical protein